jgi:DNA polymerase elongation subunit (family B)
MGQVKTFAEYVYGDTDSIFFTLNLQTLDGVPIVGKMALRLTIEIAQMASKYASNCLKYPMSLTYEKTLDPFVIITKKNMRECFTRRTKTKAN